MQPFNYHEGQRPEQATLIGCVLMFQQELLELDPWLPFPQKACCYSFGPDKRPLPIGALVTLWSRWPEAMGTCPECGTGHLAFEEGCKKCHVCGYSECG